MAAIGTLSADDHIVGKADKAGATACLNGM
jgi:hypothetical protein